MSTNNLKLTKNLWRTLWKMDLKVAILCFLTFWEESFIELVMNNNV